QLSRIFQQLFHSHKETYRFSSVNYPVIVAQRNIHHWPDNHLAVYGNWSFFNFMHTQNGRLGNIQYWCTQQRSEYPTVGNGKGSSLHFFKAEFIFPCFL